MRTIHLLCGATSLLFVAFSSLAQTPVQDQTRAALIQKLSQVQSQLAPSDPTFVSVTLRWADLLVERARFESLYELERMCSPCTAGLKDRDQALKLYSSVLTRVPTDSRPKVMLQMGHLYQLNSAPLDAERMYRQIDQEAQFPGSLRAEARLQLAEMAYKKREFAQADSLYRGILSFESSTKTQKSLAWYRQAWIEFSKGSPEKAFALMITELEKKQNFARGGLEFDGSFYEEVVRDAATFFAKIKFSETEFNRFQNALNLQTRSAHLLFLGHEMFRLGQSEPSLKVFQVAESYETEPLAKLEIALMKTQIQAQRQDRQGFIESFEQTLQTWSQVQCTQESCKEIASRIRNELVNWNKTEKGKETSQLFEAYQSYLNVFSQDQEAWLWGAQVADSLKQYEQGLSLLNTAQQQIKSFSPERLESLLLMRIDLAEKLQNKEVLAQALREYLERSQDKKKASEVEYRLAFLTYETGDMMAAQKALSELAQNAAQKRELRIKAAHLSLDALASQKMSDQLALRAGEFATLFPEDKQDFQAIRVKALLEQAVALEQQGDVGLASQKLSAIPVGGLSPQDRILVLRNRILLAEKQKNWTEARSLVREMSLLQNLSQEDQSFVQAKTLYFAELVLDFSSALSASVALKESGFEAEMRKGVFAELSGQSGERFFENALALSNDPKIRHSLAFELLKKAKNQDQAYSKYKSFFSPAVEDQAAVLFYLYNQTGKDQYRQSLINTKAFNETLEVKTLNKEILLGKAQKMKDQFLAQKPLQAQGAKLAPAIRARVKMLTDMDQVANEALVSGDWLSQIKTLKVVKVENQRFYEELMSLPAPAGLSPEEESQYLQLLMQQASPHQLKAQDVAAKLDQLLAQTESFKAYETAVGFVQKPENQQWRKYVQAELSLLQAEMSEAQAAIVSQWMQVVQAGPQNLRSPELLSQSESWVKQVRTNPFDFQALDQLIQVEKQMGRQVMVEYLEGRKQALTKSGVK